MTGNLLVTWGSLFRHDLGEANPASLASVLKTNFLRLAPPSRKFETNVATCLGVLRALD
jgi:hypothetical protein